jgi:formate hydrogenlyase subunit 4
MTLALGLLAQLVHIGLVALAAPTLAGTCRLIEARCVGRAGPSLLQPWHDLRRLMRKQSVLAENASGVTVHGPAVSVAATAVAACLVPSFALGMALAPLADLLLIVGLLMSARGVLALTATDVGSVQGGMAASRVMLLGSLAEPVLVLVLFALALLAGSPNVDVIAAMQMEGGAGWRGAVGFAFAATSLTALIDVLPDETSVPGLSGRELALIRLADALRLLVWFDLIGTLFLPFGMAQPDAGPLAWLAGIGAWLARTLILAFVLSLLRASLGRFGLPRAARVLGIAMLLGLLAAVTVLAGLATA